MLQYSAPREDLRFLLCHWLDYASHCQTLSDTPSLNQEELLAIIEAASTFAEKELLPLNQEGDRLGCHFREGEVRTPAGFREAYGSYCAAGFPGISRPESYGGSALPRSLATILTEFFATANWSWSMYPGLAHGAMDTLEVFGTSRQKALYLEPLVSGRWSSTMCLTEPQCGSDLALVSCRAESASDGLYRLTGTKIFITGGQHDLTENIVHLVLARLPNAPAGNAGLSLFLVPRELVGEKGTLQGKNRVICGGIEDKMGLKGSATCTMYFEGAQAELLGQANGGLAAMFVFMNAARIGAGQQGVVHAELGYQNALRYAQERRAMRSPLVPKGAASTPHPIVGHMDVRRMLLTQRAFSEGGRALIVDAACLMDIAERGEATKARVAERRLALVTPIIKGFLTEVGIEASSLALQCFGGHGYLREWGVEQNLRDARISTIYEGTTGIQSIDLLSRKVLRDDLRELQGFVDDLRAHCSRCVAKPGLELWAQRLDQELLRFLRLSEDLRIQARDDECVVGAAATEYLMYAGYLLLGHYWLRMAETSQDLQSDGVCSKLARSKLATAGFYFQRILPRAHGLRESISAGPEPLAAMDDPSLALPEQSMDRVARSL